MEAVRHSQRGSCCNQCFQSLDGDRRGLPVLKLALFRRRNRGSLRTSPEAHSRAISKPDGRTEVSTSCFFGRAATAGRALTAIYRITQNRKDARDVFQESISMALLHLNQFKLDSSFSTWLTRIGINCALMRRRRTSAENLRSAVSC
jgi:hypothetical protein